MELVLVSVKDLAVQAHVNVSTVPSTGVAIRSFIDECNRLPKDGSINNLNAHPEDFELYELARIDDQSGAVTTLDSPKLLMRAVDAIKKD
jgi:hypothetical protein